MNHNDISVLMKGLAPVIRDYTAEVSAPILTRLEALEKRLDALPKPKDGKDADPEAVAETVMEQLEKQLAQIRADFAALEIPEPPELPDIPAMVDEAVKALPAPKDGEPGKDGESVSVEDVMPALEARVDEYLKALPVPENGKDGADGKDGVDGKDGEKGEPGRDGLDVKDMFRADGGRLVAVMSDGSTKDLGVFVGSDGKDGSDGAPGKDGADGLGFEDMDFEEKDGRLYAVFRRGDVVKEARLPGLTYHGVWKSGEYLKGDSVTYGACQWVALEDTTDKPGEGKGWQLAVRKGRDGKDAPKEARK